MISATVVFLIVFLFSLWFVWVLCDVRHTKSIKTKFGDKFNVTYDEIKGEHIGERKFNYVYIIQMSDAL